MFTGLVQHAGRIVSSEPAATGRRLRVDGTGWSHRPVHGESICVSGCCLTLAAHEPADEGGGAGIMSFDVIPQTLALTTLGDRRPGERVNLERSLAAGDLMGGHVVQGHIDGVGIVERVVTEGEWRVRVGLPPGLMRYMVPQGSIAVEGVSLTLAGVSGSGETTEGAGWIEVALIPTTLEITTLGGLREGHRVNIEADVLAKAVAHQVERALAWRFGSAAE